MKRTYHGTLFCPDLKEARVDLYLTDKVKFDRTCTETKHTVEGLKAWTVVEGGEEAEAIERFMEADENHEYLILHFKDHNETYRNSHAILFII